MWSNKKMIKCLIIIFFIFIFANVSQAEELKKIFQWHEQGYEIYDPTLSSKNGNIFFVRKLHWPDGHEAELFSEKELKSYWDKRKQDNRFADPEVVILDSKSKKIKKIDWGWAPEISPDEKRLVYVFQKKPISGYRVLAETQTGNEIHEYDINAKKSTTLVKPDTGYLNKPFYSKDDEVIYSLSDAVNGDWGGDVGIGKINTKTLKTEILYKPQREHKLYHLIDSITANNNNVYCMRRRPASSGIYLANSYYFELIKINENNNVSVVYDWGEKKIFNKDKLNYMIQPSGEVYVYNEGWKSIENNSNKRMLNVEYGIISPDGRYVILSNKNDFTVKKNNDDTFNKTYNFNGFLQTMKWSNDSKKIILVTTNNIEQSEYQFESKFKFDELTIFEIGK